MHWRNVTGALVAVTLLAPAATARAQTVVSPEVKHTGTGPTGYEVTIRVYDPTATRVRVKGEWYFSSASESSGVPATSPGRVPSQWRPGDFPMPFPNALAPNWPVNDLTLDAATGVWSFTTPLPPGTFTYALYRNCNATPPNLTGCVATSDPSNPPWNAGKGTLEPTSQVYVPSDPAFGSEDLSWQAPNPVAGTLEDVEYVSPGSTNPVGKHYLGVYLPPGYDAKRAKPYPLMVIHHGGGGHEAHWLTQGVANRILDNVLASGKMQPAVVIFPNINSISGGQTGLTNDLMNNILPFVEASYNVSKLPNDRAAGGLSLGGQRTNELLFNRTTSFGYYGVWSNAGSTPAAGSPLLANPDLKKVLAIHTSGGLQDPILSQTVALQTRLAASGVPVIADNFNGGHEWHVWRLNLREFASKVAFRATATSVTPLPGNRLVVTVSAATTEPAVPTGTVTLSTGGPAVPLVDGKAAFSVTDTGGAASVTASYSGDALYNASTGTAAYAADSADGGAGGTVPATLALTLGAPASFGPFTAGVGKDYTATTTATIISSAGDAALTVSDPGHLTNGAFALPSPLGVAFSKVAWTAPAANEAVTITFSQHIGATDALRTGTYAKTLTFTLSTTTP
jgi:enterochelin esterase-like enzyme